MAPSGPPGNLRVRAKFPGRKKLESLLIGCLLHDAFPDHHPDPLRGKSLFYSLLREEVDCSAREDTVGTRGTVRLTVL